jgi:hypothetical protein
MSWTVGELGAHLVTNLRELTLAVRGKTSAYDGAYAKGTMGDVDDQLVLEFPERDLPNLSAQLIDALGQFGDALRSKAPGDVVSVIAPHATVDALAAIFVLDHHNHGSQLAGAGGPRWDLDFAALRLAIVTLLPAIVDEQAIRSFTGSFALRLCGIDSIPIAVDRGTFAIDEPLMRVDCHVLIDPIAFLRLNTGAFMTKQRAVLTGKLFVYGRKPWKMLGFMNMTRPVQHGGQVHDRIFSRSHGTST